MISRSTPAARACLNHPSRGLWRFRRDHPGRGMGRNLFRPVCGDHEKRLRSVHYRPSQRAFSSRLGEPAPGHANPRCPGCAGLAPTTADACGCDALSAVAFFHPKGGLSRCARSWVISVSPIPTNSLTSVASSALTRNTSMQRAISGHAGQRRITDESHRPRRVRFG